MRPFGKRGVAGASVLAVLFAAGLAATLATPSQAGLAAGRSDTAGRWLTLVTGDRVLLRSVSGRTEVVTIRPGKGREGTRFLRQDERGDSYVIPSDAAPLVGAGRLDRRLFNVSKLAESGHDDRSRADLPLIVSYGRDVPARSAADRLTTAGGRVARGLPSVGGAAFIVEKSKAGAFWGAVATGQPRTLLAGVARLWLDGPVSASLERSVPQIGAPTAWAAGHTGEGATVAVLDSGIDADHPDLTGAVTNAKDFTGSESGTDDRFGHGTHVAGIITGDGSASGGRYRGVAPQTTLLNGKVLDDLGIGMESWIIDGMQWAVEQGADVVNMSLGTPFPGDGAGPLDQALNRLTRESGTLFVVSAGNSGPSDTSIGSPGSADEALTVGAVDKQDVLAERSSRGPRWGDLALKPDITAPGVDIVAPYAEDSMLGQYAEVVDGRYLKLSGTSMAAPHVAAAAAILAAQHPQWDADELKPALMGSATPRDGLTVYQQGAGRVDVARAVTQQVFATTANVANGTVRWPHTDNEPIARTVTYRNDGSDPVTLDLSVDVRDPAGNPAPAGMFTLDQNRVTVPAGGSASVRLVTDTRMPAPVGTYGGLLTATGAQATVRTPIGVTLEAESYDLSLTFVDRAGQTTPYYLFRLIDVTRRQAFLPYDPSGNVVVRVPKGIYYFEAWVQDIDFSRPRDVRDSIVVEPGFAVTGDGQMVVDARQAQPVGTGVDRADAAVAQAELGFDRRTAWGNTGMFLITDNPDHVFVRPSTTSVPDGEFTFHLDSAFARPDGAGGFADSPYLYHVRWSQAGRVPDELVRQIHDRDLATVETKIAWSGPDQIASKDWIVDLTGPATIIELFTPGVRRRPGVFLRARGADDIDAILQAGPVVYQLGRTTERWNVGVFGPAFPDMGDTLVARSGDTFQVTLPLFADQAPGRSGWSKTDSSLVSLSRDGKLLAEWPLGYGEVDVPAEAGTYRLEAVASRSVSPLSTQVSAAWTFRSGRADGGQALPLMAVRFAPDLEDHNRAPAGRSLTVPVYVQRQAGAQFGELRSVTVEVSYDDGTTWSPVVLAGDGLQRSVLLHHPEGANFVSLRAGAVDSEGNSVEQTIIRAYALK